VNRKPEELWITNVNRFQDIRISDLLITLRRGSSINLLAKKKNGLSLYNLTRKQIDESIKSGDLYKKSNHIKIRLVAPEVYGNRVEVANGFSLAFIKTNRKAEEIEQMDFPDLDLEEGSAEDFAIENADMDAADRAPILAVDPFFKKTTE